jgi:hypothetical protein
MGRGDLMDHLVLLRLRVPIRLKTILKLNYYPQIISASEKII